MTAGPLEVLFIGGLGNQLFQFALGEALHAQTGVEVRYSTAAFPDRNGRTLGIPRRAFRPGSLTRDAENARGAVRRPLPWGLLPLAVSSPGLPAGARRAISHGLLRWLRWYVERDLDFDTGLLDVSPPARLVGFWQSWRYSDDYAALLLRQLRGHLHPVDRPAGSNPTVAVHVRLGDRRNRAEAAVHHALTSEYYLSALDVLRARNGRLTPVLFSDDVPAARALLGDGGVLVDGEVPDDDPWWVLSRMAACDHHVIANSTLSWWAARLASDAGGDVVAPSQWFRARKVNPSDRYPSDWLVV